MKNFLIIFTVFVIFITVFSTDLVTVIIVGMLVYGAMLYNYKCGDCPLSLMEDNYIDITSVDRFFMIFLKLCFCEFFKKGINQGNNFGKYEYFKNKGEDFENK